jgi:hypothetical protein
LDKNDLDAVKKTYCDLGAKEAILKLETKGISLRSILKYKLV